MRVYHKTEQPVFDKDDLQTDIVDVEQVLFDATIDNNMASTGLTVERTADGGLKFIHKTEDEFMNEAFTEVIITKFDLETIIQLEKQGL